MIKKRFVRKSLMYSAYALLLVRAGEYDQNLNVHAESLGEDIHTFEQKESFETEDYHTVEEFIEKNEIITTVAPPAPRTFVTTQSSQQATSSVVRLSGDNRMRLAENISKQGWKVSDTVFISNGFKFTDALSGTPLAAQYNAPMLLVNGKSIDTQTLNEISRLSAKNIIILGGPHSVPEHIANTLRSKGLNVRRIAGNNRYDTSRKIAEELINSSKATTAHLVNGEAYADAVSISAVAGRNKQPILLTKANALHKEVQTMTNSIKNWNIIGGNTSITNTVETQLNQRVNTVKRISGADRYEVNRNVLNTWGMTGRKIYVGSGHAFADILTGSVLAARENTGILLLSERESHIASAEQYAKTKNLNDFVILGGPNTLSEGIVTRFSNLYPLVIITRGHKNGLYTVQRGDTFNAIADSFGLSPLQLTVWNRHIPNINVLAVGQTLAVTRTGVEQLLSSADKARLMLTNNPSPFKSVHEFIDWMAPSAIEVSNRSGEEALYPSLMIAQAIHESGAARTIGLSSLSRPPYHNLFGIKAGNNPDYVAAWTWEVMNGIRVDVIARFRSFPSYTQSLDVYANMMRRGRGTGEDFYYRGTWRKNTKDVMEVLDNGGLRGYATDPEYFNAIRRVINNYNLTRFD